MKGVHQYEFQVKMLLGLISLESNTDDGHLFPIIHGSRVSDSERRVYGESHTYEMIYPDPAHQRNIMRKEERTAERDGSPPKKQALIRVLAFSGAKHKYL